MTSGHRAFQQRAKRAEGGDTTPTSYTQRVLSAGCTSHNSDKSKKRLRSPAGPRRLGTATRMSASLFRRLSAFLESTLGQDPKGAKYAVLPSGHAGFSDRAKRSEGRDSAPIQSTPVSPCEPLCARLGAEVLKAVRPMCWKRWYDCVSCAFAAFPRTKKKAVGYGFVKG